MNILNQSPADVRKVLGSPVPNSNILGDTLHGEKPFGYKSGGFNVIVGFYNDIARYVAFKKTTGGTLVEGDIRTVLTLIGNWSVWTSKPASDYFDYEEKDANGNITIEALAWHTSGKKYVFAYLPTLSGQPALMPDKTAVDNKF